MTDKFPEAFSRYLSGFYSIRQKGINDFQVLLNDVEEWSIKSPRGGITYQQKKGVAIEAKKENLSNIYIEQESFRNGKVYKTRRDIDTGMFISLETGTYTPRIEELWFDGKRWRNQYGQFVKKPLKEPEVI